MTNQEIFAHIDHTLLKPVASWPQIVQLCEQALTYHTASVCIPPNYVKQVAQQFPGLNICTVIGFPLGYSVTAAKLAEARQAIADGAHEIDMVINLCDMKNGAYDQVEAEIRQIKQAVGDHILKVIVETCYLTEEQKIAACHAVTNAGADYIKTSTGFSTGGATFQDVSLFAGHIGPGLKIKAAGGISSLEDAEHFLELGASRLGTSRIVKLAKK